MVGWLISSCQTCVLCRSLRNSPCFEPIPFCNQKSALSGDNLSLCFLLENQSLGTGAAGSPSPELLIMRSTHSACSLAAKSRSHVCKRRKTVLHCTSLRVHVMASSNLSSERGCAFSPNQDGFFTLRHRALQVWSSDSPHNGALFLAPVSQITPKICWPRFLELSLQREVTLTQLHVHAFICYCILFKTAGNGRDKFGLLPHRQKVNSDLLRAGRYGRGVSQPVCSSAKHSRDF